MDITQLLQQASTTQQPIWYLFLLAFLAGVLVSFTPCVYPMIPITAGVLQLRAQRSFMYNFLSAFVYILGLALVYAVLGYFAATASIMFGKWLASPVFIGAIVMLFLYFAGTMFGWYEMRMPSFLSGMTSAVPQQGSLVYSFVFGMISGTVASPCLTPALAILLGIVAKQANPLIGFFALFCFALGIGLLLLLVGTFSTTLTMLPRAGQWMSEVKSVFGFLLIGTCVYFLQPFLSPLYIHIGYVLVAASAVVYYLSHVRTSKISWILAALATGLSIFLLFQTF